MGKSKSNTSKMSKPSSKPPSSDLPEPTVRRSTRKRQVVTPKGDVDFSLEMQELTEKNKKLTKTNHTFTYNKDNLVAQHDKLNMIYNELHAEIQNLNDAIQNSNHNNILLYEKYQENNPGCNKNLKSCITQFKKEQNILIQNIIDEKRKHNKLLDEIQKNKTKINWTKRQLNSIYTRGGTKSIGQRDPRGELKNTNVRLEFVNKELKNSIEILKKDIETLNENIAKLKVEKTELEEKHKSLEESNTDFASFIQFVYNIQKLEEEYYNIISVNEKLEITIEDLVRENRDLNREYTLYFKSAVKNNTTTTMKIRR
jgi:chromosome segregation ATPase